MPLLSAKDWLDLGKDVAIAIIGPAMGYYGARQRQQKHQSAKEAKWDESVERSLRNEQATRAHDSILAEHTLMHKMYVPSFAKIDASVNSVRDCVNRIAGKLGVDGTS